MIVVLMGVSGCGKSTVADALHAELGWPFLEGDDLHPAANVAKMAAGRPLTDDDRWPWLVAIRAWMDDRVAAGESAIVTCSALRRAYRDVLRAEGTVFVLLHGTRAQLLDRLTARRGHFMPTQLLDSQLATLEPPTSDEHAVRVDIGAAVSDEAAAVRRALGI